MSDHIPPTNLSGQPRTVRGAMARMRALPGFTAAAVAFALVVFMGTGAAVAVAKWQQSATATIAVTVGAVPATPTPSPPAPPAPTATATAIPPATARGLVVSPPVPVLATRPANIPVNDVSCAPVPGPSQPTDAKTSDIRFSWPASANATAYRVTLQADEGSYLSSQVVTGAAAVFTLGRPTAPYGNYGLRIQPMNGSVAGDAVYRTYIYGAWGSTNCTFHAAAPSPLGGITAVDFQGPTVDQLTSGRNPTAAMTFTWTKSTGATSYVVTLKSKSSSYGAEVTVNGLSATLTFPWTTSNDQAAYFADYDLRIQPMQGTLAGDAVSRWFQYHRWDHGIY